MLLALAEHAAAQVTRGTEEIIDHGYATWFGTGAYTIGDREVLVLRFPFEWTMREPLQAEKKWGWKWLLPVTVGFHRFNFDLDDLDGFDIDTTAQSASFVPGVEFEVPLSETWRLEPFAQAGIGQAAVAAQGIGVQDLIGDEPVYIYGGGVKSFINRSRGKFDFLIANRLLLGGQTFSDSRDTTAFTAFDAGLEVRPPWTFSIGSARIDSGFFGIVSWYANRAEFLEPRGEETISTVIELGFSLGINDGFSLWNWDIPRLGMSFMRGENDFRAIRFNMGFSF